LAAEGSKQSKTFYADWPVAYWLEPADAKDRTNTMKRCPTCEKTYDDAMRFCQADGTPLEQAAEPVDPYKTMVARPADIAAAIPKSSFDAPASEPPAAAPKPDHEEVLQLPKDEDSRKTVFASEQEIRSEMASQPGDEQVMEIPPLGESPVPEPPRFAEPSLSPPSFGDVGSKPPSPFDTPQDKPSDAPDFQKTSPPIPSPFSEPKPVEKVAPSSFEPPKASEAPPSPFDMPKPAAQEPPPPSFQDYKEPEPVFQQSAGGSPFDQPSAPPPGPADWNPPAVPDAGWQNPPAVSSGAQAPAAAKGPNQTLAIISLVLGILGIIFCSGLTGPIAFIMGIMARRKAARNPAQYGGSGLALGGIITGVIGTLELLLVVAWVAYVFLVVGSAAFTSGY